MKIPVFAMCLASLLLSGAAPAQPTPPVPDAAPSCQDSDQEFAERAETMIAAGIEAQRAKFAASAPLLKPDPDLIKMARQRACDMIHGTPLSQTDAQGRFVADDMVHARFGPYGTVGETIMEMDGKRPLGSAAFAKATLESWMADPDDRADILNPAFAAGGMGVAKLGNEAVAVQILYGQGQKQPSAPCQGSDQAFAQKAEALIIEGIDGERAQLAPDAPRLKPDPELTRIARLRSCDMAHGADFSHTDGEGNFIAGEMVEQRFGRYGATGENIMKMGSSLAPGVATRPFGPEEFARVAVDGWMKSPGHRENILNSRYDLSGIGVAMVDGQAFATQIFRGPPRQAAPNSGRRGTDIPPDR